MPELFQYDFMVRALVGGTLVGLLCPTIGLFLILRGYALIGDGLGHMAFAGVGAGILLGLSPVAAAAALAVATVLGLERLRGWVAGRGDIALAVLFYTGIALAVLFASLAGRFDAGLLGFLFGSIVTMSPGDLVATAALSGLALTGLAYLRAPLFAVAVDEEAARVMGLPTRRLSDLLGVVTALTVVLGMRLVGLLLVSALMVIPAAAGLERARSFRRCLAWGATIGVASCWVGLVASFYLDIAPGAGIVLTAMGLFLALRALPHRAARAGPPPNGRPRSGPGGSPPGTRRDPAGQTPPLALSCMERGDVALQVLLFPHGVQSISVARGRLFTGRDAHCFR
jgi:zinc transport system permease protein